MAWLDGRESRSNKMTNATLPCESVAFRRNGLGAADPATSRAATGDGWQTDPQLRTSYLALSQSRIAVADAAEGEVEGVDVAGEALGLGDVDDLLLEQLREVLVEALAAGLAVADGAFELLEFALEDVLSHQRGGHHDLDDRDAA